jgi:hypothetical protein
MKTVKTTGTAAAVAPPAQKQSRETAAEPAIKGYPSGANFMTASPHQALRF